MANIRIPLTSPSQYTPKMTEVAKLGFAKDGEFRRHYAVFLNNPWFFERWVRLAGPVVGRSSLSERHKLMVIMRVAATTRCAYAWVQRQTDKSDVESYDPSLHAQASAILSTEELATLANLSTTGQWPQDDWLIVKAVDESHENGGISNGTWQELRKTMSQENLFDLVTLIGFYFMTCTMINSMSVPNYPHETTIPWEDNDNGSSRHVEQ